MFSSFRQIIGLLILVGGLWACSSEEEHEGLKIPPLPTQGFSSRKALDLLNQVIRQYPDAADNYQKRAEIFFEQGNLDAALEDINQAIELKRNIGRYYVTKARILRAKNQIDEALKAAQRAEILNVRTPEIYVLLADLYQRVYQLNKANQYISRTLQINPFYGEAYFYRGMIAAKLGDTTSAMVLFLRSRSLAPGFLDTYEQLSKVNFHLKKYPESLRYAEEGIRFHPKNADLHYRRGLAFLRLTMADSAIAEFTRTIKIEPEHAGANFFAGSLLLAKEKAPAALKYLQVLEKVNPKYPGLNFLLAQCLEYTGDDDKAMDYYLREAKEHPENRKAAGGYWRTRKRILLNNPYLRQEERYRPALALPDKSTTSSDSI
ncbi:MAG: tetratricopeptide repeat protein [Siphonobacter sp.]